MNALTYLIQLAIDLYSWVLLLRIIFYWLGVNFHNPMAQIIFKLTDPVLEPVRRSLKLKGRFDWIAATAVLGLTVIKYFLLMILGALPGVPWIYLLMIAPLDILGHVLDIFFYAILLKVILSWLGPLGMSALGSLLTAITEPLLAPLRRRLPAMSGMDLSPLVALLLLQVISLVLVKPFVG